MWLRQASRSVSPKVLKTGANLEWGREGEKKKKSSRDKEKTCDAIRGSSKKEFFVAGGRGRTIPTKCRKGRDINRNARFRKG